MDPSGAAVRRRGGTADGRIQREEGRLATEAVPIEVIAGAEEAVAALHPLRRRILEELREPDSASGVARRLGLARQKVNYHVRRLEEGGLVEEVERRRRGNCVERVVRATASHYLVALDILGAPGESPGGIRDRFSSTALIALAARTVREVAGLREAARGVGKRLPTLTLDTRVRFASPADQVAFAEELVDTLTRLVARHHSPDAGTGRTFRIVLGGYPAPPDDPRSDGEPDRSAEEAHEHPNQGGAP